MFGNKQKKNQLNWEELYNLDIHFSVVFGPCRESLISEREAAHYIHLNLRFFKYFLVSKILSFKLFCYLWGNSYTKLAILDINFGFTCNESDQYQNISRFQNIMTRIVRNFFFCSLQWWLNFPKKALNWLKSVSSIKKLSISKVEAFQSQILT